MSPDDCAGPPSPPQPERRLRGLPVIRLALDVLPLLPGACTLFFAASFFIIDG